MKLLSKIIIALFLFGCNQTNSNKEVVANADSSASFIPDSNYVIIEYDSQKHQYIIENGQPTDLSIDELVEIEVIIDSAIKKHNSTIDSSFQVSTSDYKRQYLPNINEDGDKVIWINFNCGSWWDEFEKDEIIEVMDGGNCHFELTINLTKGSYYNFFVNGYA